MSELFDLTGRTAIVTGASSGLGVEMASALAKQGANLTIVARRFNKLQNVSENIEEKYGVTCLPVKCDVTQDDEVKNVIDTTINKFGKIDILVNNAGVVSRKPTENLDIDEWKWVIDVNLNGIFRFVNKVGKHMKENNYGRIINVGSMYSEIGNPVIPLAFYHASKGGVVNFTRALAAEWAPEGITVNTLAPGFFESGMTENLKGEKFDKYVKSRCPMRRKGKKEELDGAIAFLASESSSYVTGQILYVDGGWTAV